MYKKLQNLVVLFACFLIMVACGTSEPANPNEGKVFKLAAIFPGVITDADYNTLGYIAVTSTQADLGIETAFSESVAVPDVDRVMREYIDDGYNIIFTHGGQFYSQSQELAKEFPEVHFITESDAPPAAGSPANVWAIERNFEVGFYAIGALAAQQTQTGKIGYLGGLSLPFSFSEVHAIEQAIADQGLNVELKPVWVGDFNDPTKARDLTEALIAEDVDVIIGSLNLGMFGLFEAVKKSERQVWATAKYSDKSSYALDNYLTAVIYDFAGPLKAIIEKIKAGESGGHYPLGINDGFEIQFPLRNASTQLSRDIEDLVKEIKDGNITVVKDTTPIE